MRYHVKWYEVTDDFSIKTLYSYPYSSPKYVDNLHQISLPFTKYRYVQLDIIEARRMFIFFTSSFYMID